MLYTKDTTFQLLNCTNVSDFLVGERYENINDVRTKYPLQHTVFMYFQDVHYEPLLLFPNEIDIIKRVFQIMVNLNILLNDRQKEE